MTKQIGLRIIEVSLNGIKIDKWKNVWNSFINECITSAKETCFRFRLCVCQLAGSVFLLAG